MLPATALGKWIGFISAVSLWNTVQCFLTPDAKLTRLVYASSNEARLFGTWTLVSAVVRFYGAYNLHNEAVYQLTMGTYVIALAHFASEWLIFKSTSLTSPGLISPLIVASTSFVWMAAKYSYYHSASGSSKEGFEKEL